MAAVFSDLGKMPDASELLMGNSGIFKPRPYFWHEIRLSTHREQFGESRRPSKALESFSLRKLAIGVYPYNGVNWAGTMQPLNKALSVFILPIL